ncbi:MAG: hypothetical protein HYX69_10515 [Planctomycetia bacterium]|nr:hypothetical protein [Planctomycetia bacterium]
MLDEKVSVERALAILRDVFPRAKSTTSPQAANRRHRPDLLLHVGDRCLAIKAKATQSVRIADLEGRLATASLQILPVADKIAAIPVVMIELPKLGPKALAFATEYMSEHAPSVGWCLFDSSGSFRLDVPGLHLSKTRRQRIANRSALPPARGSLFSDLNRWMLKILLMQGVPSNLWGGPRQAVMTAKDLRAVASVSTEKAYSFLRTFSRAGYLRETDSGIVVVRREELIRTWLNHELAFQAETIPVRWLFGAAPNLTRILVRQSCPTQFAVTGFEACKLLGVLHAPVPRKEIYVCGNLDTAMQAWELHRCAPQDAACFLLKMPHPKSILRGCVISHGLPVVDILEATLRVSGQVPRGVEQAQYMLSDVLQWQVTV